jgi:hypothetical protein
MTNPVTSTTVATNGAEALAGSKPSRRRTKGSHRSHERAERDDADERGADRRRHQSPVISELAAVVDVASTVIRRLLARIQAARRVTACSALRP